MSDFQSGRFGYPSDNPYGQPLTTGVRQNGPSLSRPSLNDHIKREAKADGAGYPFGLTPAQISELISNYGGGMKAADLGRKFFGSSEAYAYQRVRTVLRKNGVQYQVDPVRAAMASKAGSRKGSKKAKTASPPLYSPTVKTQTRKPETSVGRDLAFQFLIEAAQAAMHEVNEADTSNKSIVRKVRELDEAVHALKYLAETTHGF